MRQKATDLLFQTTGFPRDFRRVTLNLEGFRVMKFLSFLLLMSAIQFPASVTAFAQDEVSTKGLSLLPTNFSGPQAGAIGGQYSRVLTSCTAQNLSQADITKLSDEFSKLITPQKTAAGAAAAPFVCKMPSKFTATMACPEKSAPAVGTTCDAFKSGTKFEGEKLQRALSQAQEAACSIECKNGKLIALQEEMKCLSQQSDQLVQQIQAQLQKAYTENITRFQTDVGTVKGTIKDREVQAKLVEDKLNGSGQRSETGLVQIQAEMKAAYDRMSAELAEVTELQKNAVLQRASVLEQSESLRATLTNDCFKNMTQPGYLCDPNGAPVTAYQYVLCRFEQNAQLNSKGTAFEYDAGTRKRAQSRAQGLQNLLDQIFSNAPSGFRVPTTPEEVQKMAAQPVGNLVPANVDATYGDRLSAYDGNGLSIRAFVMKTLAACDARAVKQVEQERNLVNKPLGLAIEGAKRGDRTLCQRIEGYFDSYSQQYSTAITALTENNLPLDVGGCRAASGCAAIERCHDDMICRQKVFNMQTSCLADLRHNMEGLLRGNTQNSTVNILLAGNDSKQNISFECQGLNGCVRKIQNVSTQLIKEQERLKTFKEDYVMKANQNMESYTRQMASAISGPSQQINNRLKDLNASLASYGAGASIKIKTYEPEHMSENLDPDGLYKFPKNAMNVVGGSATPPLLNVSGDNFAESLSGMDKAHEKLNEQQGKIVETVSSLSNLAATCPKEGLSDKVALLSSQWTTLEALDCAYIANYCDVSNASTNMRDAMKVVMDLDPGSLGLDTGLLASIDSGVNGICDSPPPAAGEVSAPKCSRAASSLRSAAAGLATKMKAAGAEVGPGN